LERVAADLWVLISEFLAASQAELLAHEVDPRDLLGHAVLDLETRVDLEEADGPVLAHEELARSRAEVAGLLEDCLRGLVEAFVLLIAQERRGGLLDELLVAALEGAVARRD